MSYLHCHKCHWGQDDFWSWEWSGLRRFWKWSHRPFGYNPLSLILEDIAEYWRPRMVSNPTNLVEDKGPEEIHSWCMLLREVKRHASRLFNQPWWTQDQFRRDYDLGKAVCPKCGSTDDWDID